MRALIVCVFFLTFLTNPFKVADAFFTENYKKNILYGAFKKQKTADVYFHMQAGFVLKMWGPNLSTSLMANNNTLNTYVDAIGENKINQSLSPKYTYSIDVAIGLATHGSRFRHEIGFTWYSLATDVLQLDGYSSTINGTEYSFAPLNGQYISKLGAYSDVYKIMYKLNVDFRDVFSLLKTKWDVYFGIGAGMAIIEGGSYVGEKIEATQTEETATTTYSVVSRNVSTTNASKYSLNKELSFGVGYAVELGMIANLSQSFAASVAFSFEGVSRPLLTNRFKTIDGFSGAYKHLDYHIGLKVGILMKAFDVAM